MNNEEQQQQFVGVREGAVAPYLARRQTGWPQVPLGNLGRWSGGGTPSKANAAFWTDGTIPWVSPKDMKTERISETQDYITEEAVAKSATHIVRKGAVVVVARSGILKHSLPVAIVDCDVTLNQDLKAVELHEGILPEYVAWAIRASAKDILHRCAKTGTTVQNLEIPAFLRYEIRLRRSTNNAASSPISKPNSLASTPASPPSSACKPTSNVTAPASSKPPAKVALSLASHLRQFHLGFNRRYKPRVESKV